jgi:predicted carbohydrate-binding protein with CBM5 and CBM33 domain
MTYNTASHVITIPGYYVITTGMRAVDELGAFYNIVAVMQDGDGQFTKLVCEVIK